MPKVIDLTGQRFGKLVVLHEAEKEAGKRGVYWLCQCDCGNTKVIYGGDLRRGRTSSCGCNPTRRKIDLTGQRFGKLVVLHEAEKEAGKRGTYWLCQCDCGNTAVVHSQHLRNGLTKSCGCKRYQNKVDMTGKRFGKWTVLRESDKRNGYWVCQCECGTIREVSGEGLRIGKSASCGCAVRADDLTNQRFGKLTVLEFAGYGFWNCQCDCGNTKKVKGDSLRKGKVKSCGCAFGQPKVDLTGQRFGKLTVLRRSEQKKYYWVCQCDCGNIKEVSMNHLQRGNTKSCGCNSTRKIDMTGQRFGKLVVLHEIEEKKHYWLCQCDCGRTKPINGQSLRSGKVQSCGCDRKRVLSGQKIGMLTVIQESEHQKNRWICRCDCGNEKEYSENYLLSGKVQSCGCAWKRRKKNEIPTGVIYVDAKDAYRAAIHYKGKHYQLRQSKNIDDCIAVRLEAEKAIENGNFLEWYESTRHTFRRRLDLTGQRLGKLVVLRRSEQKPNAWVCQCDCGNTREYSENYLLSGKVQSCGCDREKLKKNSIDLTGQRFGKLVVLRRSEQKPNTWVCQCDCGNTRESHGYYLRTGKIKSCGCLRRNKGKNDLTGQRFGKLVVLHEIEERKGFWLCQCDCGNIKEIKGSNLRYGYTKTCGCLTGKGKFNRKLIKSKYRIYYPNERKPINETASGVSIHSLGFKLQYIRERRNMTAQELSRHCDVSRAAVKHWENNHRTPSDDKLDLIAAALNVDVSALYDRRIRNLTDIIHALFEIAEGGGIVPDTDGIRVTNDSLHKAIAQWADKHEQWKSGQITNEEYYDWQDAYVVTDQSEKSEDE